MTPPVQIQRVSSPPIPKRIIKSPIPVTNTPEPDFFVHPHISPDSDPTKGRLLRATAPIRAGTVLLRDASYAIVPIENPDDPEPSLACSNLYCSKRVVLSSKNAVKCSSACDKDVIWCDAACQAVDHKRHEFECAWLKKQGALLRQKETPYDFSTLWHVVRLLAGRHVEIQGRGSNPKNQFPWDERFARNWQAVAECCSFLDSWPKGQIEHWTRLSQAYMMDPMSLPSGLTAHEMLALICKEETNTFGLYTRPNGPLEMVWGMGQRGSTYGISLYPRAALFNHSCQPNVTHKPDERERMVFTAARDITPGEECMITYIDLVKNTSVSSRQDLTLELFRFRCTCGKCVEEEAQENLAGMDDMPFGFD